MSPLNRGPLMGPRISAAGLRPPMPRFGRVPPPPPGMARGMPPMPPMPPNPMFGLRGRPIPPPPIPSPRPGPMMARPGVPPPVPPMFGPRGRPLPPIPPMPPMGLRGPVGPRGPMMRPGPRGVLPPHALPHMRPRFPNNVNNKKMNNNKKTNKLEELELKKPWMTDEIRSEIQKKNKLYAKAKKNKDAKEWEEFKDLRNKVTRMIRDAKNEYLAKNPEQAHLYENDEEYGKYDDDNVNLETDEEDEENYIIPYCEVCDRDFQSEELLQRHLREHETCGIDGCTFTANPKIIQKHISMQHSTGLYQKMKNVTTEEDIAKWIAERKKRYPTFVNAQLKEAEKLEKEKRGEVINKNQNKKALNSKQDKLRKNRKRKRNKPLPKKDFEEATIVQVYRGLVPFAGTATLDEIETFDNSSLEEQVEEEEVINTLDNSDVQISDDEEEEEISKQLAVSKPVDNKTLEPKTVIPILSSLVADYGSSSDNDEPPDEVPSKILKSNGNEISEKSDLVLESNETCNKEKSQINGAIENQSTLTDDTQLTLNKNCTKRKNERLPNRDRNRFRKDDRKSRKSLKCTNAEYNNGRLRLLNKLLARSIQHERNAIFQCITCIVNHNFFE